MCKGIEKEGEEVVGKLVKELAGLLAFNGFQLGKYREDTIVVLFFGQVLKVYKKHSAGGLLSLSLNFIAHPK